MVIGDLAGRSFYFAFLFRRSLENTLEYPSLLVNCCVLHVLRSAISLIETFTSLLYAAAQRSLYFPVPFELLVSSETGGARGCHLRLFLPCLLDVLLRGWVRTHTHTVP